MSERIDPILDSQNGSVLDQPQIVNEINEEVAAPIEKTNPLKLIFNKNNKTLLTMLIVVLGIGIFSIGYAFLSLDEEVSKKPNQSQSVDRKLPSGKQTEIRREEIERFNNEKDDKTQPIALEQIALHNEDKIDGSFESESLDIDPASGCGMADTACMRIKKRIAADECAPKDEACKTIMAAKKSNSKQPSTEPQRELTEREKYAQRINDPEYMKVLADEVKNAAKNKSNLVQVRGGIIKFDPPQEDKEENSNTQSTIDSGILKPESEEIELLASSGDRMMGSAEIALNSKIEGEASFAIFGGQFIESRMLGTVKRKEEFMRVELDTWILPDKRECKIKAIALDKKTTYAAIASRVDYHTLYRYGWWGLGTVLSAAGSAAEKNADKELIIVNGAVVESTTADSKREIRMAVGDLGAEIGKIMQKRLDTPPTVFVDINETVGIFFMTPVTTGDCKFGGIKNGATAGNSAH